ncbi:hypothetical protein H0H93_003947, partial [Arthromyces matolae]
SKEFKAGPSREFKSKEFIDDEETDDAKTPATEGYDKGESTTVSRICIDGPPYPDQSQSPDPSGDEDKPEDSEEDQDEEKESDEEEDDDDKDQNLIDEEAEEEDPREHEDVEAQLEEEGDSDSSEAPTRAPHVPTSDSIPEDEAQYWQAVNKEGDPMEDEPMPLVPTQVTTPPRKQAAQKAINRAVKGTTSSNNLSNVLTLNVTGSPQAGDKRSTRARGQSWTKHEKAKAKRVRGGTVSQRHKGISRLQVYLAAVAAETSEDE